jgi:hypothetical protein
MFFLLGFHIVNTALYCLIRLALSFLQLWDDTAHTYVFLAQSNSFDCRLPEFRSTTLSLLTQFLRTHYVTHFIYFGLDTLLELFWLPYELSVRVTLRLTVSQSVLCRAPSGAHHQILVTLWQLLSCPLESAFSDERTSLSYISVSHQ